ncbi:hypothetical protein H7J93_13525 [Mycobacterium barrassiae]|uniref:hypothetical protein n=1 Tax=Mycobacterium barrassiae TaxID=319709 RepID=UPI002265B6C6|nr:hypothetical protein [Mycobacterium barrassiae]MCV7300650.1 hypothetical protein [Mycobacterium barrassiae]
MRKCLNQALAKADDARPLERQWLKQKLTLMVLLTAATMTLTGCIPLALPNFCAGNPPYSFGCP